MSQLLDLLLGSLKGGEAKAIAASSGMTPEQGRSALQSALPMVLQMLANHPSAAAAQGGAQGGSAGLMQMLSGAVSGGGASAFGAIAQQMLGGGTSEVAAAVQQSAGVQPQQANAFVNNLLPLIMKSLHQHTGSAQGGVNISSLLGGAVSSLQSKGGGVFGGLLDQDGDGDVDASDMMKLGAKALGNFFK